MARPRKMHIWRPSESFVVVIPTPILIGLQRRAIECSIAGVWPANSMGSAHPIIERAILAADSPSHTKRSRRAAIDITLSFPLTY